MFKVYRNIKTMSKVKPVIIKKNLIINDKKMLQKCLKNITQEDIIYKASSNDFLDGKFPNLIITNRLNKLKNCSRTIARYSSVNSTIVEITSDAVSRLIGEKNYETLFAALCSVINQQLKIQGILSLLTPLKAVDIKSEPHFVDRISVSTQTHQTCMSMLIKEKRIKNSKRCRARPYVIKDTLQKKVKKVVVNPSNIMSTEKLLVSQYKREDINQDNEFPELKSIVDEDSNISNTSEGVNSISSEKLPQNFLELSHHILDNVDKYTVQQKSQLESANELGVTLNPEGNDIFHLIKEDTLIGMSQQDQHKLLLRQTLIDFKYCLSHDENGNLPLHNAVLQNDVNLVRRQCIMLKKRNETVDKPAKNDALSALQMAVLCDKPRCTVTLLEYGADALLTDDDGRSVFHLAAEAPQPEHLAVLIEFYKKNARQILNDNEDLWEANMEKKSDAALAEFLLHYISILCDTQGYTPLMLASKLGLERNVKLLIEAVPDTINKAMPNSGNTALYLAVGSACGDAEDRGDKTTVAPNFLKTIDTLIVNGADPYLQNSSGCTVNDILSECNIKDLSLLIANKLTSVKFFDGNDAMNFDSYMLVKNAEGKVNIKEMKKKVVVECPKKQLIKENSLCVNENDTKHANELTIKEISEKGLPVPLTRVNEVRKTPPPNKIESVKMKKVNILQNIPLITKIDLGKNVINKTNLILIKSNKINPDCSLKNKIKIVNKSTGDAYNIEMDNKHEMSAARTKKRDADVNVGASCSKKQKH